MIRYIRVLAVFYKAAVLTDLEYRANFVANLVLSLANVLFVWVSVATFFQHTNEIGGWGYWELLVIIGLFTIFEGVIEGFLYPNVKEFVEHIRQGTMDFILLKPINAQFHATLRRVNIWRLTELVVGSALVTYALAQLGTWPGLGQLLLFGLLLICGTLILYSLVVLLVTSAFWFVQLENVMELMFIFFDTGRFPVTAFPAWVRIILTFVVPIAFVTTIPAGVLIGRFSWSSGLVAVGITAVLLTTCILFWNYAVRHYSSASS